MSDPSTNEGNKIVSDDACTKPENYAFIELFYRGLYYLHDNNLSKAEEYIGLAVNNIESLEIVYFECLSFMGLVQVLSHKNQSGLKYSTVMMP